MSITKTLATAKRVLNQLKHDPRTLAMLFIVPPVLLILLKYVLQKQPHSFQTIAPIFLGIIPMIMMFLIASIATLRERSTGTLDRLMTMPISKLDFLMGYALAFFSLAFIQAIVTSLVLLGLLGITVPGGAAATIVVAICSGLLGTALGLLASAFSSTEFQTVQLMPLFLLPQLLVCGLFIARPEMPQVLQWLSYVMPLTYVVDAMKQITLYTYWTGALTRDLIVVLGVTVVSLILGSITIRRQEKN